MSRIVEPLKRLNVKNDAGAYGQDDERVGKKNELTLSFEETVSLDQNYVLFVSGTQRQISCFFIEHFMSHLRRNMTHVLQICFSCTRSVNSAIFIV